jgi:hypothetical protein
MISDLLDTTLYRQHQGYARASQDRWCDRIPLAGCLPGRDVIRTFPSAAVASRLMVPALAEPDIHLLSKTPRSPHRRLSLCSLPVPKQFIESLQSLISIAQSPDGGTWQPAHRNNPDVFAFLGRFLSHRFGSEFLGRHEILLPSFHREKIGNQFSGPLTKHSNNTLRTRNNLAA